MTIKTLDDFDKQINDWHEDESTELELHEYLGLSWEQYSTLVEKGEVNA